MLKYIIKRLALSVLILIGVSLIIYFLIRLMPVNFVQDQITAMNQGGATIDQSTVDKMYEMYGLEPNPTFGGIVKGYWNWLKALCQFDLGTSFTHKQPVAEVIINHMGVSFAVALIATIFEFMIAIPLGITAARCYHMCNDRYFLAILLFWSDA